ncbi:MAG: nucleotidyltransferase family protein [Actinomycetota bacterium]
MSGADSTAPQSSAAPPVSRLTVAAIVLAAGSSRRLGRPKQLLPYRGSTLLSVTLDGVRGFGFGQAIIALGGAGEDVRAGVDLDGLTVVDSVHHTQGCSSSIVAALDAVDRSVDGFLLFLGDQPDIPPAAVDGLLAVASTGAEVAVVDYTDGLGHPFWFARSTFPALADLHGDKAVWKLLESGRFRAEHVAVDGELPLDVDTWDDYQRLLAAE